MSLLTARGEVELERGALALDVALHAGEVVALVGPNASGKTATVRTLVGLHRLSSGRIEVDGRVVDDGRRARAPHRRRLGWAPQEPALIPRRTPRRQVAPFASPAAPLRASHGVDGVLTAIGLPPTGRLRPAQLSGGQAQRVAVARALLASRCVLLDEPTSAQDADGTVAVRTLVRDHAAAGGAALVIAHRPEDAYGFADRVVVLQDGRIVQSGTPAELAAAPATAYVAQVVGATVLDGQVDAGGVMRGPWGQLTVPDGTPRGGATAVIRPASVVLHPAEPVGSSRNVVRAVVTAVQDGPTAVTVRLDGRPALVAALTHAAAAELRLRAGDQIWASVKATDVHVVPAADAGHR